MELGLGGKLALVVGGSAGIGKAIALELAREGARVAIWARRQDALSAAAAEIQDRVPGAQVMTSSADVTEEQAVAAVASDLKTRWGSPAVLVNAAGRGKGGKLEDVGPEQLREMVDLNLLPCLLLAREFAPNMAAAGWGRIIFISAVSGRQPTLGQLASNVAKAGVINLTKELSLELAESGVTVNTVLPGRVATERVLRVFSEEEQAKRSSLIPMRRYGRPEELACAIAFLASDRASYITGAALAVDGGLISSMF